MHATFKSTKILTGGTVKANSDSSREKAIDNLLSIAQNTAHELLFTSRSPEKQLRAKHLTAPAEL